MTDMECCHQCGRPYDDSFPDWTICGACYREQLPDDTYVDSLGIAWSPDELAEAGGRSEVDRLCSEAKYQK